MEVALVGSKNVFLDNDGASLTPLQLETFLRAKLLDVSMGRECGALKGAITTPLGKKSCENKLSITT